MTRPVAAQSVSVEWPAAIGRSAQRIGASAEATLPVAEETGSVAQRTIRGDEVVGLRAEATGPGGCAGFVATDRRLCRYAELIGRAADVIGRIADLIGRVAEVTGFGAEATGLSAEPTALNPEVIATQS